MKRAVKRIVLALGGVLLVGVIVFAMLPRPVPVEPVAVVRGSLQVTVEDDGKTRLRDRYIVSAPLAGRMLRIDLRAGDVVRAGKTLLTAIEPADPALLDARARAEALARVKAAETSVQMSQRRVEQARASLDLAREQHTRSKRLLTTRGVSREEYDTAEHRERSAQSELRASELAVQVSEFELELARAALVRTRPVSSGEKEVSRLEITAPIDGKVLRIYHESSAVVQPGQQLVELGDPTDLEVEVDVLSSDGVKIAPGAKVVLEHWGGDEPLRGRVRLVEPQARLKLSALGVEEQRVNVIIDLTDPQAFRRRLGDGYRVEARIVIWEGQDVLKVPAGAVFRHGDSWAVFVAAEGRAELRVIEPGRSNGLETEVRGGLAPGEQVIVHPSDRVRDGVAVVPR